VKALKQADGLTPRERRFALEYLVDLNATQAAVRAGLSAKTAHSSGPRMVKAPRVQAFIAAALARREAKLELTAERVLLELARVGLFDIGGAYGPDGQLLELAQMPEDVRRALVGLESEQLDTDDGPSGKVVKVRFADKIKALELLGKHLKLFTDVLEAKVEAFTEEEREARVAELLERARARRAGRAPGPGVAEVPGSKVP
jgi:phage terminase small subunit